ncbi:MAG: FliM/FliN family flagellar motor switch protein [Planctomycetota bacterium]
MSDDSPSTDEQPEGVQTAVESADDSQGDEVNAPEFQNLQPGNTPAEAQADIGRFRDVQVTVSAELGRTSVAIQDLLKLAEGSVFELNRSINEPVELIAQGVPLGNGEVVVVDESFAVRIKEIYSNTG